jgi:branched-chain amino acid transport system permease protein
VELFVQRVLDGLASGAVYSSMALAIVIVFMASGAINFAQGAMGMFCAFVAWHLSTVNGWPLILAAIAAVLVGVVGGAAIGRVFIVPLAKETSHLPVVIATLGLMLAITVLAGEIFTLDTVRMDSLFTDGSVSLGGVRLEWSVIGMVLTLLVLSVLIRLLFQNTRLGLAMRASVDNLESARLVGISQRRMLTVGWALGGGLGAFAAVLIAPVTFVHTGMLDNVLFYGFAAAVVGGLTSPGGAIAGGILIGLVQSLVPGYIDIIGNQLSIVTAFAVMALILLAKPEGMFGRVTQERV